jgi:hypothetical protein
LLLHRLVGCYHHELRELPDVVCGLEDGLEALLLIGGERRWQELRRQVYRALLQPGQRLGETAHRLQRYLARVDPDRL